MTTAVITTWVAADAIWAADVIPYCGYYLFYAAAEKIVFAAFFPGFLFLAAAAAVSETKAADAIPATKPNQRKGAKAPFQNYKAVIYPQFLSFNF